MAEPIKLIPNSNTGRVELATGLVLPFQKKPNPTAPADPLAQKQFIQDSFIQAVTLEETSDTLLEAMAIYQEILKLNDKHAPSCINLGTIYYNQRNFHEAEKLYRQATNADPDYALAWFDLGNVLDERCQLDEAIHAYKRAVEIAPEYADAHYNLALTYERLKQHGKALPHWKTYKKLDPIGPWAGHASGQIRKIIGMFQAQSGLAIIAEKTQENQDDKITNQASSAKEAVKNETQGLRSDLEQVRTLASEPELKDNALEMPRKRKAAQTSLFPNIKKKMKHTQIQYSLFLERKRKQKRQNRITTYEGQYKLLFPKPPSS